MWVNEFQRSGSIPRQRQQLGKLVVDAPIARFVGLGQGRASHRFAQTHVVEFSRLRRKTCLDSSQTLPCKAHTLRAVAEFPIPG